MNVWLSFSQADLGPRSAQDCFFSGFLKSLELFFSKFCAHSERYRNPLAGIFEILTFYGNIEFPLSPVLSVILLEVLNISTTSTVADESGKMADGVARSPSRLCSKRREDLSLWRRLEYDFLACFCALLPTFRFSFLIFFPASRYV